MNTGWNDFPGKEKWVGKEEKISDGKRVFLKRVQSCNGVSTRYVLLNGNGERRKE